MITKISELSEQLAKQVVEDNPKYARAVNAVVPPVVGMAATAVTGNPVVGTAASTAISATAAAEPNAVAELATAVVIGTLAQVAAVAALPVIGFLCIKELFTSKK